MNGFLKITAVLALIVAGVSGAAADEAAAPVGDDMMAKMKEMSSPGANHRNLDVFVGKWTHTFKMWMNPDSAPEESTGTTEGSWILDGRHIRQTVKGTMMGQPFEGMGILGYDNVRGEYTGVWVDNMSTGTMTSTSQYDTATMTFSEAGDYSCPMTGKKDLKFRGVTKIIDPDHISYEMYSTGMNPDGSEFKTMEIQYARVKE